MGSIVAHLMRRLVEGIKPAYANESRSYELLAAGCAAGVAATFSAPVGGNYSPERYALFSFSSERHYSSIFVEL